MQQKNKDNKHITKLKYLKFSEFPKNSTNDDTINVEDSDLGKMWDEPNSKSDPLKDKEFDSSKLKKSDLVQSKKFEKVEPKSNSNNMTEKSEANIPAFLQKFFPVRSMEADSGLSPAIEENLKMLPFAQTAQDSNPNSFSSIFNKDHQEVFGVQRVFKKSIVFLALHLVSFGLLLFVSLNLFTLPIWISLLIVSAYIALTNVFYIIVADRSYVWLSLFVQIILSLIVHAFVGLSFDKVTLVFTLLVTLLSYFAYVELEKVQLSSRLFSISHITTESIRILLTVVILVLCLGVFNKSLSQGSENFISEAFLDKPLVLNNLIIGKYKNLSLNRFMMKGRFYIENNLVKSDLIKPASVSTGFVFADFLAQNYKPSNELLSEDKKDEILSGCDKKVVKNCDTLLVDEKQKNLENWRKEAYSNLPYTLDTELSPARFEQITKQFYVNEIKKFNADNSSGDQSGNDITYNLSKWLIIPKSYLIPAFCALILFLVLSILKPILRFVVFLITWLTWKSLVLGGFAKINIEKVEAEIVSI